jgi:hypothetical protein
MRLLGKCFQKRHRVVFQKPAYESGADCLCASIQTLTGYLRSPSRPGPEKIIQKLAILCSEHNFKSRLMKFSGKKTPGLAGGWRFPVTLLGAREGRGESTGQIYHTKPYWSQWLLHFDMAIEE